MDFRLFHWVNRFQAHTAWAHGFFRTYAKDGIALFAVVLLAGWWGRRSRNDLEGVVASVWAAIAALIGLALNQVIGSAVGRARPYLTHPGVHLLVARTKDVSFPSDHAVVAGAVAAGLLLVDRRVGIAATVLAAIMAFARVYVGAHYPGDVIGGLLIGAAIAVIGYRPAVTVLGAIARWALRTPAGFLITADRHQENVPTPIG